VGDSLNAAAAAAVAGAAGVVVGALQVEAAVLGKFLFKLTQVEAVGPR